MNKQKEITYAELCGRYDSKYERIMELLTDDEWFVRYVNLRQTHNTRTKNSALRKYEIETQLYGVLAAHEHDQQEKEKDTEIKIVCREDEYDEFYPDVDDDYEIDVTQPDYSLINDVHNLLEDHSAFAVYEFLITKMNESRVKFLFGRGLDLRERDFIR
jgi:hypothetical protein